MTGATKYAFFLRIPFDFVKLSDMQCLSTDAQADLCEEQNGKVHKKEICRCKAPGYKVQGCRQETYSKKSVTKEVDEKSREENTGKEGSGKEGTGRQAGSE